MYLINHDHISLDCVFSGTSGGFVFYTSCSLSTGPPYFYMHAHLGFGSLLSMFILCEDEGGEEAESDQGSGGVTHPIPLCRIPPSDPLLVLTLSHHR